jgi:hypothetical protein
MITEINGVIITTSTAKIILFYPEIFIYTSHISFVRVLKEENRLRKFRNMDKFAIISIIIVQFL